jgi:hypothetical protein
LLHIELIAPSRATGRAGKLITRDDVHRGLDVMARETPKYFADLMSEKGDVDAADVLMQCLVFGKRVFGCSDRSKEHYSPEARKEFDRFVAAKRKVVERARKKMARGLAPPFLLLAILLSGGLFRLSARQEGGHSQLNRSGGANVRARGHPNDCASVGDVCSGTRSPRTVRRDISGYRHR